VSLADKEWLKPSEVAAIIGWSYDRTKNAIRNERFGKPRETVSPTGMKFLMVSRAGVETFLKEQKGGRHGRR